MKVKVYRYKVEAKIDDDFLKVQEYFVSDFVKSILPGGIPITFDFEDTNISKENSIPLFRNKNYDITIYIADSKHLNSTYWGWAFNLDGHIGIYIKCDELHDKIDYTWKSIAHELMHAIRMGLELALKRSIPDYMDFFVENGKEYRYYKNDDPYAKDGNFARTLKAFSVFMKPKYRYFNDKEADKMTHEFMEFADELRHRLGFPLNENSGFRTPSENKRVGGVSDSPHLYGKAKDWKMPDGTKKYKFTEEAQKLAKETGKIIGIGTGDTFMHLDVGHRKVNTMWNYK